MTMSQTIFCAPIASTGEKNQSYNYIRALNRDSKTSFAMAAA
jgi:hypothetical protein